MSSGIPTVSCHRDPLDVRPAIDALENMIRQRSADGPLIVLMGEEHMFPANQILPQAIASRFKNTSDHTDHRIAYGMEWEHNSLNSVISNLNKFDDIHLIHAFRAADLQLFGLPAERNMLAFCRHHSISVRFNDAASACKSGHCYLDASDPQTKELMGDDAAKIIGMTSPQGMALRNKMIINNALQHMEDTKADIYIQQCGAIHLFGNQKMIYPDFGEIENAFSDSLTAVRSDVNILPVFVTSSINSLDHIPPEAMAALQSGLVIDGLDSQRYWNGYRSLGMDFLSFISLHSGNEIELMYDPHLNEDFKNNRLLSAENLSWVARNHPSMIHR